MKYIILITIIALISCGRDDTFTAIEMNSSNDFNYSSEENIDTVKIIDTLHITHNIIDTIIVDTLIKAKNMRMIQSENTYKLCFDSIDNDNDGLKDCDDTECQHIIECIQPSSSSISGN